MPAFAAFFMKARSEWETVLSVVALGVGVAVGVGVGVGSIWARSADEREAATTSAAQPRENLQGFGCFMPYHCRSLQGTVPSDGAKT